MIRLTNIVPWALVAGLAFGAADLSAQDQPVPSSPSKKVTTRPGSNRVEGHVKKILALAMELREAGFEEAARALIQQAKRLAAKNRNTAATRRGSRDRTVRWFGEGEPDKPGIGRYPRGVPGRNGKALPKRGWDLGELQDQQQDALTRAQESFRTARASLEAGDFAIAKKRFAKAETYLRAAEEARRAFDRAARRRGLPPGDPSVTLEYTRRDIPYPKWVSVPPPVPGVTEVERVRFPQAVAEVERSRSRSRSRARPRARSRAPSRARSRARSRAPSRARSRAPSRARSRAPVAEVLTQPEKPDETRREIDLDDRVHRLAEQVQELRQMIRDLKRAVDKSGRRVSRGSQAK